MVNFVAERLVKVATQSTVVRSGARYWIEPAFDAPPLLTHCWSCREGAAAEAVVWVVSTNVETVAVDVVGAMLLPSVGNPEAIPEMTFTSVGVGWLPG